VSEEEFSFWQYVGKAFADDFDGEEES